MNDKNIEEKSEEYAKDCSLCPTLESQDEIDGSHREEIERAYTNAYNQAVTDQRNTLTQYKEALRELWSDIHFTDISKEEISDRIGKIIQSQTTT